MAQTKTKPTGASVDEYLASRGSPEQIADGRVLMTLCERATGAAPRMWGPSIVGCGVYTYRYDSGHSGQACQVGFAIRGREVVLYLDVESAPQQALLARVGKHKMGKACFYFKRLADLDLAVLESLIQASVAEVRRRYPEQGQA